VAVQFDVVAAPVSTNWVAATARTVIECVSGANHPPEWCEYVVFNMAATGYTTVDFVTYAATGTGTAYTPKKHGQAVGTAETTAKVNLTVEGTTPSVLWSEVYANPFTLRIQYPLGRELFHPVSTVMGIRLTPSVVPDATHPAGASLMIEE
jgi:hypothetical protein